METERPKSPWGPSLCVSFCCSVHVNPPRTSAGVYSMDEKKRYQVIIEACRAGSTSCVDEPPMKLPPVRLARP